MARFATTTRRKAAADPAVSDAALIAAAGRAIAPLPVTKRQKQSALVASGRAIDITDRSELDRYRRRQSLNRWQDLAWAYNGAIPILGFSHDYVRDSMARVRPFPAILNEDDSKDPIALTKETLPKGAPADLPDLCGQILGRLAPYNEYMGQVALKFDVAGECHIALIEDDDMPSGERCAVLSNRELLAGGDTWVIREDETDPGHALPADTPLWRMWVPDPEFSYKPFSPMVRLNMACEQLLLLNRLISAVAKSRLATTGTMLAVAEEFHLEGVGGGDIDAENPDEDLGPGTSTFFQDFVKAGAAALLDPESAAAVMPLVIRGPHALIKDGINVIDIFRKMEDVLLRLRQEAREEIATGVNIPREIPLGVGATNHWNAEEIRTQSWLTHLEPRALTIVNATTTAYYQPQLLKEKIDPELVRRLVVWYDPTWFIGEPDRAESADEGLAAFAISLEAWRAAKGWDEDDAPTEDEIKMRIGWQQQQQVKETVRPDPGTGPEIQIDAPTNGSKPKVQGEPPDKPTVPETPSTTTPDENNSDQAKKAGPAKTRTSAKKTQQKSKALAASAGTHDGTPNTGVMVALMIPDPQAQALAGLMGGDPDNMHCTVAFCGDESELDDQQVMQLAQIVAAAAHAHGPIDGMTVPGLYEFGQHNDERAVVMKPYLPGVHALHTDIVQAAEQAGLPVRTNFAYENYQPHVTLGYLEPDDEFPADMAVPAMPLHLGQLSLVVGERQAHFPLGADRQPLVAAARRKVGPLGELGGRHVAIERDLRIRLTQLADALVGEALQKAGVKVRNKAMAATRSRAASKQRDTIARLLDDRPGNEIPSLLGEDTVRALGFTDQQLLDGALGDLHGRYSMLVKRAQHAAARAAAVASGRDDYDPDELDAATEDDREAGWTLLKAGLLGLAASLLFNPHPSQPDVGEFDESALVPPGLIRAALNRAGGAPQGPTRDIRGADVPAGTLFEGDLPDQGGATAGPTMLDQFRSQLGISQDGMTWVYGDTPRSREFEPHRTLDGQSFSSWEDPILENSEGWPDFDFYHPGDHNGCGCDVAYSWATEGEDATLLDVPVELPEPFTRTQQGDIMDAPRGRPMAAFAGDFDEAKHPRGGDPANPGRFSTGEGDGETKHFDPEQLAAINDPWTLMRNHPAEILGGAQRVADGKEPSTPGEHAAATLMDKVAESPADRQLARVIPMDSSRVKVGDTLVDPLGTWHSDADEVNKQLALDLNDERPLTLFTVEDAHGEKVGTLNDYLNGGEFDVIRFSDEQREAINDPWNLMRQPGEKVAAAVHGGPGRTVRVIALRQRGVFKGDGTFTGTKATGRKFKIPKAALVASIAAEYNEEDHPRGGDPEHPGRWSKADGSGDKTEKGKTDWTAGGTIPPPSEPKARGEKVGEIIGAQMKAGKEAEYPATEWIYDHVDDPDGKLKGEDLVWQPEREALHEQLVNDLFQKAIDEGAQKDGQMIVTAGLPGAGKTTSMENVLGADGLKSFVTVNPDDFKVALANLGEPETRPPGLGKMESSALIHEESSYLAQQLADRAMADGYNILWDITGKDYESIDTRVKEGEKAGYSVTGIMADTTIERSMEQAENRYETQLRAYGPDGARYTPPHLIESQDDPSGRYFSLNRANFDQAVQSNQFDRWIRFENRTGESSIAAAGIGTQQVPPTKLLSDDGFVDFESAPSLDAGHGRGSKYGS